MKLEMHAFKIEYPEGCNIIIGQTHFIKTAEDLYEAVATTVPQARFGIAFSEASGPCLIRTEGNDDDLIRGALLPCRQLAQVMSSASSCAMPIPSISSTRSRTVPKSAGYTVLRPIRSR